METNRSLFVSHGYLINSTPEQLEIQISESGDTARYRSITRWSSRGTEVINGRWQEKRKTIHNNVRQKTLFNQLYA